MKLAIDSLPINNNLQSSTDYSGLQLWGLCQTTLADTKISCKHPKRWTCELDGSQVWQNDDFITTKNFYRGIESFFQQYPLLANLLFKDLNRLSYDSTKLIFDLKRPNQFFGEILKIPFLVPLGTPNQGASGDYFFSGTKKGSFQLQRKSNDTSLPCELEILHVQSFKKNLELFESGQLDVTADTALPLTTSLKSFNELETNNSGLFAGIEFSKELQSPEFSQQRRSLHQAMRAIDFTRIHAGLYHEISKDGPKTISLDPCTLSLAYDEFYPNKDICEQIALELKAYGVNIQLTTDNYYNPTARTDMKFVIKRGHGPHPYFKQLVFLSYPALRNNHLALTKFSQIMKNWEERGLDQKTVIHSLSQTLDRTAAFTELFTIPSMALNRSGHPNPLLKKVMNH